MKRLWLLALALLLLVACQAAAADAPTAVPTVPGLERVLPEGAIPALDDPTLLTTADADGQIGPLTRVLGVTVGGEARAYPLGMLSRREIVNDTVGGQPITVTFCPLCNSAAVVSRVVAGQPLTFLHSGDLLDGALVMADRESGSLWPQSRLRAISGRYEGQALELLAANQMAWADWKAANPATTLATDGVRPLPMGGGSLLPTLDREQRMVAGYVLGSATAQSARAYPLDAIAGAGVINDEPPGGPPLLLVALGEPGAIAAWQRTVDGQALTFQRDGDGLVDAESGSRWDARTGQATDGPLAGSHLLKADLLLTHWLGWADLYPQSEVWEP